MRPSWRNQQRGSSCLHRDRVREPTAPTHPHLLGSGSRTSLLTVRAWLFNKGVLLKADQLTVADIAAVARANANRAWRRGTQWRDVR
jgi:hypothetical protein